MDTEAVQEAAPTQADHLSALPVELIMAILGELSVPEICRARALSTHFKAIIDTHQLNILRPIITRHKARISYDYQTLCRPSADLCAAYQGLVNHYGRLGRYDLRAQKGFDFSQTLVSRHYRHLSELDQNQMRFAFVEIGLYLLARKGNWVHKSTKFVVLLCTDIAHAIGEETLARQVEPILSIVPTTSSRYVEDDCFIQTRWPNEDEWDVEIDFVRLSNKTTTQLDLPSMDQRVDFGYYVKKLKLGKLVRKAQKKPALKLSVLEAAAVVEGAFIY